MWNGPIFSPAVMSAPASTASLLDVSFTLDEEAEMLALKLMSMLLIAM